MSKSHGKIIALENVERAMQANVYAAFTTCGPNHDAKARELDRQRQTCKKCGKYTKGKVDLNDKWSNILGVPMRPTICDHCGTELPHNLSWSDLFNG
jgi:hypothetical protein